MGKSTQLKQAKNAEKEALLMNSFVVHNVQLKQKAPEINFEQFVIAYQKHFIRPFSTLKSKLKSDSPQRKLDEIVKHVFGRYSVSKPLQNIWVYQKPGDPNRRRGQNLLTRDYKLWYVCVATGGSLYKEYLKSNFTKKEVHTFVNCAYDLTVAQALCYSVARCINNHDGFALRIARSKLHELFESNNYHEFYAEFIRFFARHTPDSIDIINDLTDYLVAKKRENANYSSSGKTLDGLMKSMKDWHYELRRIKVMGDAQWEGTYLPDETFSIYDPILKQDVVWKMTQVKTAKDLAAEGNRMRHCVYSYKQSCIDGYISIWSLAKVTPGGIQPKVTIELKNNGAISQARGLANRGVRSEESRVIHEWVRKNGLRYNDYY